MARPPKRPTSLSTVRLWWYAIAVVPIALLVAAPLLGWLPGEVIVIGLFALFFWIFSLGFAIYARVSKPRDLRQ